MDVTIMDPKKRNHSDISEPFRRLELISMLDWTHPVSADISELQRQRCPSTTKHHAKHHPVLRYACNRRYSRNTYAGAEKGAKGKKEEADVRTQTIAKSAGPKEL